MAKPKLTPMLEQFLHFKHQHPDKIVLFRMGDFYETFFGDAEICAKILNITLTTRNKNKENSVPLAGFPYHSLSSYLPRLITANQKVVICEQMEDPKKAKGLVKREIVDIITPGSIVDAEYIHSPADNYLTSLVQEGSEYGLASVDISTGKFSFTQLQKENLTAEIERLSPKEILVLEHSQKEELAECLGNQISYSQYEDDQINIGQAETILKEHFSLLSLAGIGLGEHPLATKAAAMAISHLKELKKNDLKHISKIEYYSLGSCVQLDKSTVANLELTKSLLEGTTQGTLLQVLDQTCTPMGGRKLKQWLLRPLMDQEAIENRHNIVEEMIEKIEQTFALRDLLNQIGDIARLTGKLSSGSINPKEILAIAQYLNLSEEIKTILDNFDSLPLLHIQDSIQDYQHITAKIEKTICTSPQKLITQGGIVNSEINPELHKLHRISSLGKSWILDLEKQEKEKLGIHNLKIDYNKIFGYYIEISKRQASKVPEHYIRKQTLVNCERFISPELKEFESKVLGAEERIKELEYEIFCQLRTYLQEKMEQLLEFADTLALLDVYANFAQVSFHRNYCKPKFNQEKILELKDSFHPVIKELLKAQEFIPNDIYLDNAKSNIILITGPNMAGKSTYLRQVALSALMAQIGCYVPARTASMPIFDKIFTRVGASDNLAKGQSTFLVEMLETASILNFASQDSLVILDEIGRGTSTYDGLSLAWAIIEHLHHSHMKGVKTLFATHYHELTHLADTLEGVRNYNVIVEKEGDKIIFMHKVLPGKALQSYGIDVAQLAGIPMAVISRAKEILQTLEDSQAENKKVTALAQLDAFSAPPAKKIPPYLYQVEKELQEISPDQMTPIQALQVLSELKKIVSQDS